MKYKKRLGEEDKRVEVVVCSIRKEWFLAHADDLMVLAMMNEREAREMTKIFERYVRKQSLELNVIKAKLLVFKNMEGDREKNE